MHRTVNVTITGTNDTPVVTTEDLTGAVTELVTPVGNLTDTGAIAFTDVDLTDVHLVRRIVAGGHALGSLTAVKDSDTTGTGPGGQLTWTYTVADGGRVPGADQTKVETFTLTLNDARRHGHRAVTVTITGTNDAPVITADVTGAVTEQVTPVGDLTDTGAIAFTDVDLTDVHGVGWHAAGTRWAA